MCNQEQHEHTHTNFNKNITIVRLLIALLLFAAGLTLQLSEYEKFTLFLISYTIAGIDILLAALKNIFRGRVFDENFLMAIASLGAFAIKEYPEAVMVIILYQIGEYFQHKAIEKSRKSITELMNIRPDYANTEKNGELLKISPENINVGDIIIVKTGEKIPLDGIITDGKASVDFSALTGESIPKELTIGDNAISGCINTNGLIKIKVSKPFVESTVSKILELVENAGSRKTKAENFITKFARYYTPSVIAGAFILAIIPPLLLDGNFNTWLLRALTFLVISCPCALVISVPLSFFAGIGGASKNGILIKGSSYIEALSNPDTIVFDKTGTLTKGSFNVTNIVTNISTTKEELIKLAAMAENYSNHPIAISIKTAYGKKIDTSLITNTEEFAGNGVIAQINGEEILVGNDKLMKKYNINYPQSTEFGSIVYISKNKKFIGYIVISDELKEDSIFAIKKLKNIVPQIVMLTGDTKTVAEYTAKKLSIDKVFAELLPLDKVSKVEELLNKKNKNKSLIFVGDGINDAPVLTRADIGIAMGGLGSDAAIEAADIVIMDDKPSKVFEAIKIARRTMNIVKQNITFAIGIKVLFLVLGTAGLMTMWGAVFSDVGVTLIAVINALRTLQTRDFVKK